MSANEGLNKRKKGMLNYIKILSSLEGRRVIITLLTILFCTIILSSKYFSFNSVIDEKGVSKQVVVASKTIEVVDQEATKEKKLQAKDRASQVYKDVEGNVNQVMSHNLATLLKSVDDIRVKYENSSNKTIGISKMVKDTPLSRVDTPILNYMIVETTDYNWKTIEKQSNLIFNKILNSGLSAKDITDNKEIIIRAHFSRYIPEPSQEAIVALLDIAINQPNKILDDEATQKLQKEAMEAVGDVKIYFEKGQLIVNKGAKPTLVQMEALKQLGYTVNEINGWVILGILFFVVIAIYIVWYYLSRYEPKYANSSRHLAIISSLSIIALLFFRFVPEITKLIQIELPVYIFPMAAVTLIITFFSNSRISLLVTFMIIFLISVIFRFPVEDIVVMAVGSIIAVFKSSRMSYYRDFGLIETGIAVGLAQILVVLSNYILVNNIANTPMDDIDLQGLFIKCFIALISGLMTGALTIAAMPYLEAIFNIVTAHGLIELADQNQPLLRRLQFEAPGTYHHSLMVSTLAEAAAEAIGASTILVRVGAFYHDIGKLKRPSFFIENQAYFGTENPHDKLNPRLSKMVLAAHAKDGLDIAKQYKLPEVIQDMIIEHHGDGIMIYFYRAALELEGPDKVLKEQFRYMGPKPSTKESALIMLADATESAVRSLRNPSISAIEEKINKIIDERLQDDQLSETPLTLKDLKIIATTFVRVLRGMQHHRIEYHETMLEELSKKHQIEQGKDKFDKNRLNDIKSGDDNGKKKEELQNGYIQPESAVQKNHQP